MAQFCIYCIQGPHGALLGSHSHVDTRSEAEYFRMNMLVSIHQGFGHRDRGGVVAGLCGAAVIAVLLLGPQTTRRTLAASLWPHRVNRIRLSSGFLLRPCSEGK